MNERISVFIVKEEIFETIGIEFFSANTNTISDTFHFYILKVKLVLFIFFFFFVLNGEPQTNFTDAYCQLLNQSV